LSHRNVDCFGRVAERWKLCVVFAFTFVLDGHGIYPVRNSGTGAVASDENFGYFDFAARYRTSVCAAAALAGVVVLGGSVKEVRRTGKLTHPGL